ncbi:hypothetical protein SeMB42_g03170 [Synchytrium endobioticum]|uniref:4-hydroxybenzoate polyprenyltransferase, mitochondrial n=1 Tax=Synchytrium endobioticum TaxID=286115 RepID=A0A507D126_9FUNG|nr:hypothetical protein SeLEV6574_g04109 [Synchytrium endobioticum]TPX47832.1 hypothetical protein SeMB42_g03170 [Synchytrium endobioticum]
MASYAAHVPAMASLKMLGLFGIGAFLLRGAGCTINDLWDRDIDKLVARTRDRPLAARTITPRQAVVFLGAQLSLGLMVLTQLNMYSIVLGASSMVLVVTYPLMKRVTFWPQGVLGLTFNWGALLGWSAMTGKLDLAVCLPLYAAGVFWTLHYDTVYAIQDVPDDRQVGVKSTALMLYDKMKVWLSGFAATNLALLTVAGAMNGHGVPYYVGLVGAASHYVWQIWNLDVKSAQDCARRFASNATLGFIVFLGIAVDCIRQRLFDEKTHQEMESGTVERGEDAARYM